MFEAFQIGPFLFRSHILFLLIGIWLASELLFRITKKEGLRISLFLNDGHWYVLSFLIGGRLLAMMLLYRVYLQNPARILIFWDGSFSVVGGCMGIATVLFMRTLKRREPFLKWLDVLMPPMALLMAFEWFGRFLGAVSYGKPTNVPWGMIQSAMHVRYTVPVHPTQLYYALWFLGVTLILLMLHKRRFEAVMQPSVRLRFGMPTLVGVILSALAVVIFESFRGDFAVMVFAKWSDFLFLGVLFASLGIIAAFEKKVSTRYSLANSILVGFGTVAYIALRPYIPASSIEWRFSQFLAVLAMLAVVVYVVAHRWKYPRLSPPSFLQTGSSQGS